MDFESVQRWLDSYVDAWRTNDPEHIAALFSRHATYAYHPWDAPLRGREAIVADWLDEPDETGSWHAEYRPLLVDGNRAVATGETHYADGSAFSNLFVIRFDRHDKCVEFVEWYMSHPKEAS